MGDQALAQVAQKCCGVKKNPLHSSRSIRLNDFQKGLPTSPVLSFFDKDKLKKAILFWKDPINIQILYVTD